MPLSNASYRSSREPATFSSGIKRIPYGPEALKTLTAAFSQVACPHYLKQRNGLACNYLGPGSALQRIGKNPKKCEQSILHKVFPTRRKADRTATKVDTTSTTRGFRK